jgi:hypothetical protein
MFEVKGFQIVEQKLMIWVKPTFHQQYLNLIHKGTITEEELSKLPLEMIHSR